MAIVQLSLDEICRGCLSRENLQPLGKLQRIETLAKCVDLEITLDDGLPTKICSDCWDHCVKWNLFKEQFRKTDATLRCLITASSSIKGGKLNESPEVPSDATNESIGGAFVEEPDDILQILDIREVEQLEVRPSNTILARPPSPIDDAQILFEDTHSKESSPAPPEELSTTQKESKGGSIKVQLICPTCNKQFRKQNMLDAHIRQHEGKKPFVCKECLKEFNSRLALRNHAFTHSATSYPCPDCGREFNYPQLMEEHRKRKHTVQEKCFGCTICDGKFSRAQTLKVHMLTHTNEKPVECTLCHLRFKSQTYLNIHQVRHSDVKKFECPLCQKAFFTKSELNFHKRNVHTTDKPHQCSLPTCQKNFVKLSQLLTHMKTHSGKKFKCDQCPLPFASATARKVHIQSAHGNSRCRTSVRTATRHLD